MLKPYKYLHYRIYASQLKMWGEEYVPEFNALFLVSYFLTLNCYFLIDLAGYFTKVDVLKIGGFGTIHSLAIGFAIVGVSYVILVKDGRYKKTAEHFNKESKGARTRNLILCILYVTTTFVMGFGWQNWFPLD